MPLVSSIDSASSLLWWSNIIYIGGAVLTLGAAMHVRHEKRAVDKGKRSKVSFASEASVILAAIVSLCGTGGAIYFGGIVSHLKDVDLETYKAQANVQIAQANQTAMDSLAKGVAAQLDVDKLKPAVSTLQTGQAALAGQITHRQLKTDKTTADSFARFNDVAVRVHYLMTDEDGNNLANQLTRLFTAAHIRWGISSAMGVGGNSPLLKQGVHIFYDNTQPAKAFTQKVAALMKMSDVTADASSADEPGNPATPPNENLGPNQVNIWIGPKF